MFLTDDFFVLFCFVLFAIGSCFGEDSAISSSYRKIFIDVILLIKLPKHWMDERLNERSHSGENTVRSAFFLFFPFCNLGRNS